MPRVMFCLRYFLFGMRSAFGRGEHWLAPRSQSQATVIAEEREAGLVKIDLSIVSKVRIISGVIPGRATDRGFTRDRCLTPSRNDDPLDVSGFMQSTV
jgi:hypothetical protein